MSEAVEHSSLVGGSSAEKRINCPGSYQMEAKLPATAKEESSVYADEGTALHSCIEYVLRENVQDLDGMIGTSFNDVIMTQERLDEAIGPCLDFIDALEDECDAEGGLEFVLEKRCAMPGIPGAFGTSDFIGRTKVRSIIVDWKFGQGVPVLAEYEREDGTVEPNAQPMFYARSAMHDMPDMFGDDPDWPVDIYIVQPRLRDGPSVSHHRTTRKKLEEFRMKLVKAVAEAKGKNPSTKRGPWCRFAACKAICPHHTGPALDLAKMQNGLAKTKKGTTVDWGEAYSDLLTLADLAEAIIAEVRKQAHAYMEAGHTVPGYKLVDKRAVRKWIDEDEASVALRGFGLEYDELFSKSFLSPAQAEKMLKKMGEELPEELVSKTSSGTTLAHENDKRASAVVTATQLNELSKKLAALAG